MSASLESVQVVFLDKISISPEVKAVNLSLALSGVYLTLLASPSTAAATALHTSTSTPVQFPAATAFENPGRPWDTPHLTKPLLWVFLRVFDLPYDCFPPCWSQATTKSIEAAAKTANNCFEYLNIYIPLFLFIYLFVNK